MPQPEAQIILLGCRNAQGCVGLVTVVRAVSEGVRAQHAFFNLRRRGRMSVFHRARARLLACLVAAVAVLGALVFVPTAGAANVVTGSTYLALGDSLSYGFHAKQFSEELASKGYAEAKNYEEGFVNDFGASL